MSGRPTKEAHSVASKIDQTALETGLEASKLENFRDQSGLGGSKRTPITQTCPISPSTIHAQRQAGQYEERGPAGAEESEA